MSGASGSCGVAWKEKSVLRYGRSRQDGDLLISKNNITGDTYRTDEYDQHSCNIEFFSQVCIIHDHSKAQW